jgi:hypothetical protein
MEYSATFKLTRDSQGAPYSMEDLQDYRMKLRDTRDPWGPHFYHIFFGTNMGVLE